MQPDKLILGHVYHRVPGDYFGELLKVENNIATLGPVPRTPEGGVSQCPVEQIDREATPVEENQLRHQDAVCTCGRRMREFGPWEHVENLDHWRKDRWNADEEAVKAEHAREDAEQLASGQGKINRGPWNDRWLWSWGPARSCSFCGCVHPEDALNLLKEGWESETTGKSYKRYLHPPGWKTWCEAFSASIKDVNREPGQGVPSIWEPTPPMKLYVQHMSDDQIKEYNAIMEDRRMGV